MSKDDGGAAVIKQNLERLVDPSGNMWDCGRMEEVCALFGMTASDAAQTKAALAFARRTISPNVMADEAAVKLQSRCKTVFFSRIDEGELCGFFAVAPIRQAGLTALQQGSFDLTAADSNQIGVPDERVSAIYWMGASGESEVTCRAVVQGVAALSETLFWRVPIYGRAVTSDGARVLQRLDFQPTADRSLFLRRPRAVPLQGFREGPAR